MQSLKRICLDQVCMLLKKETWKKCVINPFSSMETETIDTLMRFLLFRPTFISTRDKQLLFQSGQLSKLELSSILVDKERVLLLEWMTKEICTRLRVLSVRFPLCDLEGGKYVVREILQRCCYLEDFHSKLVLDLDDLKNCHQLKNLRLHLRNPPHNVISEELLQTIIDFVQSKKKLEVFSFCNIKDTKIAYKAIAASLENCPELISVGLIDSLEALFHIRRTIGAVSVFKLKRCLWGVNEGDDIPEPTDYRRRFPNMVLNAVQMCPAVETLVINVHQEHALEHLNNLKKLKSLSLKFIHKSADNVTTLVFLLKAIGNGIEHLSLDMGDADQTIPVEVIRDHCINLKTLQIYGAIAMKDGMENCLSPLKLQRLYLWKADTQSLYLFLRNSPNLTELYLGNAICLDEELVDRILMNNFVLPNLIAVGIKECLMTTTAIGRLVRSARNLEKIFFGTVILYEAAHEAITDSNANVVHYYDNFKLYKRQYYTFRPDSCSF